MNISINIATDIKTTLSRIIADPYTEFEARFGSTISSFDGIRNELNRLSFRNILKKLKDLNLRSEQHDDMLDIFICSDVNPSLTAANFNYFKTRFTVSGIERIKLYCSTNLLNSVDYETTFKQSDSNIDIIDYKVRLGTKQEISIEANNVERSLNKL